MFNKFLARGLWGEVAVWKNNLKT